MPSLSALTQEKGKTIEKIMNKTSVQMLHYTKLRPSDMNFYSQTDIEDLADSLVLAGRILQPLIVRRTDIGEYEVLAGHRRRNAAIVNVERGMKQFEFLPCIVLSNSDLEQVGDVHGEDVEAYLKYILIATNSSARELTEYERMLQTIQLKEILPKMRGDENLKGRALRNEIAKETKKSTGAIGTYEAIWKHLSNDWMRLFEKSKIGISVAAGIAGLHLEEQKKLFLEKGENVALKDIELVKKAQQEETVSDSDTEEPVNTEWKYVYADEKVCEKVIRLVFFDYPHTEEVIRKLKTDGLYAAFRFFEQKLPYRNKCIEVDYEFGYCIRFLLSGEKTTITRMKFWDAFKTFYNHRFMEVEENVELKETVKEAESQKKDTFTHITQEEKHEPLEGQLTTQDIGIGPDEETVSESDTPIVITEPEKQFDINDIAEEFGEYICDTLCKHTCGIESEEFEQKCAECKVTWYIEKILEAR